MSNFVIALLIAIGSGTWIYSKMYNRTGGNNTNAITVAALGGFVIFLFVLLLLSFIPQ